MYTKAEYKIYEAFRLPHDSKMNLPKLSRTSCTILLYEYFIEFDLAADYLTEFSGYANEDFIIETPVVSAEEALRLQVSTFVI